jgi:hypothetical protein
VDRRKGKIDGHVTDTSACGDERRRHGEDGQGRMGQGSGRPKKDAALKHYQAAEAALKAHNEQGCIAALKQAQAALK